MATAQHIPAEHTPLVIAHRAANALDGLQVARDGSAHMIEADVHLFRGRLEVRHLKTVGPIRILWDRWRLANPYAPQLVLEDVLEATASLDAELVIDLKGRSRKVAQRVRDAIALQRLAGRHFTICARAWHLLDEFESAPDLRLVHSVGSNRQLRRLLHAAGGERIEAISIHERLLTESTLNHLQPRTAFIMTWPVNSEKRARELRAAGVHALISDNPASVFAAFYR
jgi:glycerophosphoryl diester phosphodiesterase